MPKYSIITPVNLWTPERADQFLRCIASVKAINYQDFEWVVVDDGSPLEFLWEQLLNGFDLNLIRKSHGERIIAYNEAFKIAKGDWWIFLDSDDELDPEVFNKLDQVIIENPKYKMFNFGAIYKYNDGTETKRVPFKPKELKKGHEVFGGGNIVNGTFVFHRLVYEKLGGFPPDVIENINCDDINYPPYRGAPRPFIRNLYMNTPYDFAAAAQLEFPEIRRYFMVDHEAEPEYKIIKELGNPWGNDYYIFYKYTRKYHSKPIEEYLYVVHPKG